MKRFVCVVIAVLMLISASFSAMVAVGDEYACEKLTPTLKAFLESINEDEELDVYIILNDVDEELIMDEFSKNHVEEYEEYVMADENENNNPVVYGDISMKEMFEESKSDIDIELLQRAIKTKRDIYAVAYSSRNHSFIDGIIDKDKQIFVSVYSPMIIARLTKTIVIDLCNNELVSWMDLFEDYECIDCLARSNRMSSAAYVRDHYGNRGYEVIIGQIETGVPDTSVIDLDDTDTIVKQNCTIKDHATRVARILVGESQGIAPDATLFCTGASQLSQVYPEIEWLLGQGVNIINASFGFGYNGAYDTPSQWVDHIAMVHNVHFVTPSGNYYSTSNGNNYTYNISSFGMGYNVITVGGFDDLNNDTAEDDIIWGESCYQEANPVNGHRPEKPNLVASCENIYLLGLGNDGGTSFAAPQVAGVIAQLCSYKPSLLLKQSVVGAMIAAGTFTTVSGSDTHISGSDEIWDKQGAGKLYARGIRSIAVAGNHWKETILTSSFPYIKNVYIDATSSSKIRIAIFWLMRNKLSNGSAEHELGNIDPGLFTNLDLKVYAPNGSLVGSSTTLYSNYEIIEFSPSASGTYKIKIIRNSNNASPKEIVGIAAW